MIGIAALFFLQTQGSATISIGSKSSVLTVVTRPGDDSVPRDSARSRPPLAPDVVASAYRDADARAIIARAREARVSQDTSLRNYSASTLQRLTAGIGLSKFGRDRILLRYESSANVKWQRGTGASVEITGRRAVAPAFSNSAKVDVDGLLSPIPYFPGRDALWVGSTTVKDDISTDDIVHPLATGAEEFYIYQSGDSATLRLSESQTIRLREVLVRPRVVKWNAVVGSLWFDAETGQLVRGAYKFSEPLNLWEQDGEGDSFMARALIDPAEATITGMAVEYGLHEGKFWLPRTQAFSGVVRLGFATLPLDIQETYQYDGVNVGGLAVEIPPPRAKRDTTALIGLTGAARDSARRRIDRDRATLERETEESQCARTGFRETRVRRYDSALLVGMKVPCNDSTLAHSPTLPASIYDDNDPLFTDAMRDELLGRAESLMPMPTLGFFRKPTVKWSLRQLRFNRVEGLSSSVIVDQELGRGLSLEFTPRIGSADRVGNGEFSMLKKRTHDDLALTGYRRLAADTYWGDPLSFGSSLSSALFGRDEGMYYRTTGVEISGVSYRSIRTSWRVFTERESEASSNSNLSLPRLFGSDGFDPRQNILAQPAKQSGAALRFVGSHGRDPAGFRTLTDVRVEESTGDFQFGRESADLTLSQGLFGPYGASLTMSAGTSHGDVPVQSEYYLGGSPTVRGQTIGGMHGNAYWFSRLELGKGVLGRRVVFADVGWAGDREEMSKVGRPMSGVGVGFSAFDGLFRVDIARGLYPARQFRVTLYMDAKY